jgi:hypothetical protein
MAGTRKARSKKAVSKTAPAVLSLSTTDFDRPLVEIDGKMYEMRNPDELTPPLVRKTMEAEVMMEAASDESASNIERFDATAAGIAQLVDTVMVDLPEAVRDKLSTRQQMRIVSTFNKLGADDKTPSQTD